MSDQPVIVELRSLLFNTVHTKLTFTQEGLTVEKPSTLNQVVFFPAENITSIRFGVNWIRGYKVIIGRQFMMEIKDDTGQTSTIKMTSLYQFKRKRYAKQWSEIFDLLWQYYFQHIFRHYINLYNAKQRFDLGGIEFYPFGIRFDGKDLFWNEIALSNYRSYFMIHHRDDVKKNVSRNFKNDWNAIVLQYVLKEVVKEQDSYRTA